MLFNPFDSLLKRFLGVAGGLVTFKQAVHNLRVGFFVSYEFRVIPLYRLCPLARVTVI